MRDAGGVGGGGGDGGRAGGVPPAAKRRPLQTGGVSARAPASFATPIGAPNRGGVAHCTHAPCSRGTTWLWRGGGGGRRSKRQAKSVSSTKTLRLPNTLRAFLFFCASSPPFPSLPTSLQSCRCECIQRASYWGVCCGANAGCRGVGEAAPARPDAKPMASHPSPPPTHRLPAAATLASCRPAPPKNGGANARLVSERGWREGERGGGGRERSHGLPFPDRWCGTAPRPPLARACDDCVSTGTKHSTHACKEKVERR